MPRDVRQLRDEDLLEDDAGLPASRRALEGAVPVGGPCGPEQFREQDPEQSVSEFFDVVCLKYFPDVHIFLLLYYYYVRIILLVFF